MGEWARAARLPSEQPVVVLLIGLSLLVAWWLEARRLAVGTDGSFLFFGDVAWDPPVGWLPWALVMLLATAAYASGIVGAVSTPKGS